MAHHTGSDLLRRSPMGLTTLRTSLALGFVILLLPAAAIAQDTDGDSILDLDDNCILVPNRLQIDSDCDDYGNACDADFDQNGVVNVLDLAQFQQGAVNQLWDVAPPFNGVTDASDEAMIVANFGNAPGPGGPSTSSPSCGSKTLTGARYCVVGTATGGDYAWEISGPGITTSGLDPVAGVPAGAGAQTLMLHIQSSIDSVSNTTGVTVSDISLTPDACFSLSHVGAVLTVGPAGNPTQCTVTGAGCPYNPIIRRVAPLPGDQDADSIPDLDDNCTLVANPLQLDGDCDGYGNACDADFNQNGLVNAVDYAQFVLGAASAVWDVAPPFSGVTDVLDEATILALTGTAPGPAATNPAPSPSCSPRTLTGNHYCATGTATGAPYAWQLTPSSGPTATQDPVPGLPPGASAQTLMLNLQASVHDERATTGVHVTEVAFTPDACFALSDPMAALSVGTAGNPTQCVVGPAGCTFNPTVYQVLSAVPTLSPGAIAALIAALCAAPGVLVAVRRRARA